MAKLGFSLSDYWLIIRKRKVVLVVCYLGILFSVVFHIERMIPVYKAVCSIRFIERKSVSDMITQMVTYTSYDIMASMPKVLMGRPIVEKVVRVLGMVDRNSTSEEFNDAILKIQGKIEEIGNKAGVKLETIIANDSDR